MKNRSFIFFLCLMFIKPGMAQVCDTNTFQSIYWNKGVHDSYMTNMNIGASGDVYISGYTESAINKSVDAWIMKLTVRGNPLWSRAIGTSAEETVSGVKKTTDGGFIIMGGT